MKIKSIDYYPIDLNKIEQFQPGVNRHTIIIIIRSTNGLIGFGEAPAYTNGRSSNLKSIFNWLQRYRDAILTQDELNLAKIHDIIDEIDENSNECNIARAGIDIAVHDIIGKYRECPVHQIIGGSYRTEMELMLRIKKNNDSLIVTEAQNAVRMGFHGITINFGNHAEYNSLSDYFRSSTKILVEILKTINQEVYICLDANQQMVNQSLVTRMMSEIFESKFYTNLSLQQPFSKDNLNDHAEIREKLPIPIQLSDSVSSDQSMMQIELLRAADRISLSLERVGGLNQANRIRDICEASFIGIHPQIKSLTPIGFSAHLHLAATMRDPFPIEIGTEIILQNPLFENSYTISGGKISLKDASGLGITLDENQLKFATVNF